MTTTPDQLPVARVDAQMVRLAYPDIVQSDDEISTWIEKATRLLYGLLPGITQRVLAGRLDVALVEDKIVEAVGRVLRAPDPRFLVEAELGYRYQLNQRAASGTLWFPDDVLAVLRGASATVYGTVGISPGRVWSDSIVHRGRYGEARNADQRIPPA